MIGFGRRMGIGPIAFVLVIGACGGEGRKAAPSGSGTTSIAADYGCTYEGADSPTVAYELRQDGTFTIHSFDPAVDNTKGSWSAQGDSGAFEIRGKKEQFTIQDDRLVFAEYPPPEWFVLSYDAPSSVTGFVCFRQTE